MFFLTQPSISSHVIPGICTQRDINFDALYNSLTLIALLPCDVTHLEPGAYDLHQWGVEWVEVDSKILQQQVKTALQMIFWDNSSLVFVLKYNT